MLFTLFTLELVINPILLAAGVLFGIIVGYAFRKRKLMKLNSKILKLEEEMINSHAEILEIQKAYVNMENNLMDQSIPVISMKHSNPGNSSKDNPKGKASK